MSRFSHHRTQYPIRPAHYPQPRTLPVAPSATAMPPSQEAHADRWRSAPVIALPRAVTRCREARTSRAPI